MQSTPAVLKLCAQGWENTNSASRLLHLHQEESLFPFHVGMLLFIFSSCWKIREIQEAVLINAWCSGI